MKLIILIYFVFATAKCQFHRWCDPYATFCLFSNGVQSIFSNVKEAQEVCERSKEYSWPLEIYDDQVMNIVKNFTSEHFSNGGYSFILNANFSGSQWRWIKNGLTVTNQACIESALVFDSNSKHIQCSNGTNYNLICMTSCYATWNVFNNTISDGAQVNSAPTVEECKKTCETDRTIECIAVNWAIYGMADNARCWLHNNKTGNNSLISQYKNGTTQYIIDRTNKSVDVCLANLKTSTKKVENSGGANALDNAWAIGVGVGVSLAIVLIIVIVILVTYKCYTVRKVNKTTPNTVSEADNYAHISPSVTNEHLYNVVNDFE